MPVLTFVDTLGIQSFVFASNRLKDVVGGSWLVDQVTAKDSWAGKYRDEIIIGAGGNLLLQFADDTRAKRFAAEFSRRVIDTTPGLEATIVHHLYADGQLAEAIRSIQVMIEREKLERQPNLPLLGLGVTATCRETQLPATAIDDNEMPLAAGVAARREQLEAQDSRWQQFLPPELFQDPGPVVEPAFPRDLDNLGRSSGDTSM
jgi:hypothetical protein